MILADLLANAVDRWRAYSLERKRPRVNTWETPVLDSASIALVLRKKGNKDNGHA